MTNLNTNKELTTFKTEEKAPETVADAKDKNKPLGLGGKAVFRQVAMVVLANLGVFSGGMALGYPAVTLKELTDTTRPLYLTASQASWFASINAISCPLGGLLSGYLLDKVGRKRTFFTINFTAFISWLLLALTTETSQTAMFIQIMIARFIIGITTGLSSSPVGVYSAEICHPRLRGRLTLGTSVSTAAGILAIYTLGYVIRDNFRMISAIACGYSVIATILTIPVPESPSWLMMKGRSEESKHALRFFRALKEDEIEKNEEFNKEFSILTKSATPSGNKKDQKVSKIIRRPEIYKPLLIMIGLFGFQQFSGIFVVIVYAVQFSIEAGVTVDPIICAMLVGLTRITTTFLVGYILDKWGRRPPAMLSGFGMMISMFVLAATSWFPEFKVPYLPVACIVFFIFTSTLGLMTLPFSMISEVYPQVGRGFAAGLTICCGYLMSFIIIKLYPTMVSGMGNENVFAFYGVVSGLAVFYVYFFLPETKGKTLHEIEAYFRNEKKVEGDKNPV